MRRILYKTARIAVIAFVALIISCFVFDAFVQYRLSDTDLQTFFQSQKVPLTIHYYTFNNRLVRYISVGNDTATTLLFIHGAPGSCSNWKLYLSDTALLNHCSMCAVDRLGYGYSGFGKPEPSFRLQALAIKPILDSLHTLKRKVVLVAASYGTSIACRITMDFPNLVDGVVLLAPSLQAGEERYFWFTYLIEQPWFHWFIPRMLQSANNEKVHHAHELQLLLPYWRNIRQPITYLQGADDELVYTSNAAFAQQQLAHAKQLSIQFIPNRGHVIAHKERKRITEAILTMLQQVK